MAFIMGTTTIPYLGTTSLLSGCLATASSSPTIYYSCGRVLSYIVLFSLSLSLSLSPSLSLSLSLSLSPSPSLPLSLSLRPTSYRLTHTDLKPENILFVSSDFDIYYDARKVRGWPLPLLQVTIYFHSLSLETRHSSGKELRYSTD